MKDKVYILVLLIVLAALFAAPVTAADSKQNRERQIKAAFLYNFINFVEWPKEKMPDNNEPIIIGIIGNKDFVKAFDPIKGKQIRGKDIVIKYFKDLNELKKSEGKDDSKRNQIIDSYKKCHILFFSALTNKENITAIVEELKGTPVLVVGENPGFLESGGNIRFLTEEKKIRFEINLASAKHNNVEIRSKLLKLARRVIKEEESKDTKN